MKYKRILLKLSGEVLAGKKETGIDFQRVLDLAREIKEVSELGVQIGISSSIHKLIAVVSITFNPLLITSK